MQGLGQELKSRGFMIFERNIKILDGILGGGGLANGYVFYGVGGSFVEEGARYLAQGAHCVQFDGGACGVCKPCQAFVKGTLVDHFVLEHVGSISVELIRSLQEVVKYGPRLGSVFTVIIPGAQHLTPGAANAFLKTLEEPPSGVSFILVADTLSSLLPTVRSRCHVLDFPQVQALEPLEGMDHVPYQKVVDYDVIDRLRLAELLSKDKGQALLTLQLWMAELWKDPPRTGDRNFLNLELIIENILHMKYNLNLRLSLENLLVRI